MFKRMKKEVLLTDIDLSKTRYKPFMNMVIKNINIFSMIPYYKGSITSLDGLKLYGRYYKNGDSKKTLVFFHGYHADPLNNVNTPGLKFLKDGYNLLLITERAHGNSEGKYITFGVKESEDAILWLDFLNKEYHVLVCTTIVETGMDISNANTMIIYDADKMGLAQLYQLRGRVGRSSRQGYAYLMYEKDKVLSEVAEKRLKAIKEFTEFGSGFKIAMRDLEIRGAGNILGSQQHGHMAVIGYDLYVKMLNDAIRKVKGELIVEDVEVEIDLSVNAYIPDYYIDDELIKLEMYKKIACIENKEDLAEVKYELEDRFSDIPRPVETLLNIAYIKSLCKKLKIEKVRQVKNEIILSPLTKYKTKETLGHRIVEELQELLEKMLKLNN